MKIKMQRIGIAGLLFAGVSLFYGCDNMKSVSVKEQGFGRGISVVEYEGHQYLFYKSGYGGGLCHLESCTNNTHGKHP